MNSSTNSAIYKCPICDTVIEVLEPCGLEITCCGPEMIRLKERVASQHEPHALMVETCREGLKVSVGHMPHQMEDDHYISWIELSDDGKCCRQFLEPGERPEAVFNVHGRSVVARAYCSAHGLWRSTEKGGSSRVKHARAQAGELLSV